MKENPVKWGGEEIRVVGVDMLMCHVLILLGQVLPVGDEARTPGVGVRSLSVGEIEEVVRAGRLPFTLVEMTDYMRGALRHDRPALRARWWRLFQAYFRFKSAVRVLASLRATRHNLEAVYELHRQQQRRSEVDDLAVLGAHNALLNAERAVYDQETACRLIILEILETVAAPWEAAGNGDER